MEIAGMIINLVLIVLLVGYIITDAIAIKRVGELENAFVELFDVFTDHLIKEKLAKLEKILKDAGKKVIMKEVDSPEELDKMVDEIITKEVKKKAPAKKTTKKTKGDK